MLKIFKNTKGESLLELIIAFVIFALSITVAGMIMGSALRNMQNAKNRIVAINIAREGIEAVRNIRDTNWLKFHSKRRECWNQMPNINPSDPCSINNYIKFGNYIIYKQGGNPKPTFRWMLGDIDNGAPPFNNDNIPLCTSASNNTFYYNTTNKYTYKCNGLIEKWENITTLSIVDIDKNVDTDGDHNYTNDADFYNNMSLPTNNDIPLGSSVKESVFMRVIKIEYINNQGTIISSLPVSKDVNRMRVTSTVSWVSGAHTFKVELITHLTDYLGREKLDG